jgi:hypothetical protein
VRDALVFLPDHSLPHIALAEFETDSKRADYLREFGLARLPKNSVVCTRAGEMLLAQHRPELALAAVDKALLADHWIRPLSVFDSKSWTRCPDESLACNFRRCREPLWLELAEIDDEVHALCEALVAFGG